MGMTKDRDLLAKDGIALNSSAVIGDTSDCIFITPENTFQFGCITDIEYILAKCGEKKYGLQKFSIAKYPVVVEGSCVWFESEDDFGSFSGNNTENHFAYAERDEYYPYLSLEEFEEVSAYSVPKTKEFEEAVEHANKMIDFTVRNSFKIPIAEIDLYAFSRHVTGCYEYDVKLQYMTEFVRWYNANHPQE